MRDAHVLRAEAGVDQHQPVLDLQQQDMADHPADGVRRVPQSMWWMRIGLSSG